MARRTTAKHEAVPEAASSVHVGRYYYHADHTGACAVEVVRIAQRLGNVDEVTLRIVFYVPEAVRPTDEARLMRCYCPKVHLMEVPCFLIRTSV